MLVIFDVSETWFVVALLLLSSIATTGNDC